jgi:DNA-binding response OmpR family regulator
MLNTEDDYLTKPIEPAQLEAALERWQIATQLPKLRR